MPRSSARRRFQSAPTSVKRNPRKRLRAVEPQGQGRGGWFRPYDPVRHPDFHIQKDTRGSGYRVRMRWRNKIICEHFGPREYGSPEMALKVAKAFALEGVKDLPKDYKPTGWRLGIMRAGNVEVDDERFRAIATLQHNGEKFKSGYAFKRIRSREEAVELATKDLERFRRDLLRRERRGELGYDWFGKR